MFTNATVQKKKKKNRRKQKKEAKYNNCKENVQYLYNRKGNTRIRENRTKRQSAVDRLGN